MGDDKPLNAAKMDLLNNVEHKKEKFLPCAQPLSSVHINVDGTVFPCLAVSTWNIQEKSIKDIIFGEDFKKFKNAIRKAGTVEACNRCGWLQPNK